MQGSGKAAISTASIGHDLGFNRQKFDAEG
jgi:hypothetical protein